MKGNVIAAGKTMGRLSKGDDLLKAIEDKCKALGVHFGEVRAIGAVSRARIGYYDQDNRRYTYLDFDQPMEIVSLIGNISIKDGEPFVHAHIALADNAGRAFGGHLAEGTTVFACEVAIEEGEPEEPFVREFDEETGLYLWPVKQERGD